MRYKLERKGEGDYATADGLFRVWHADRFACGHGFDSNWYVNHRDFDETCCLGGFRTKAEAVEWLKQVYEDREPCYFDKYTA